jgi:hypothetical protein
LPHLDPAAVLIMAAPQMFTDASPLGTRAPGFARRAADGEHWLIHDGRRRLPVVFMERADATTPAAAVIPFDAYRPDSVRSSSLFSARSTDGLQVIRIASSHKHCSAKPEVQPDQPGRRTMCATGPSVSAAAVWN